MVGVLVVTLALSVVPDAAAATQTNRWTAGIGSGGANGSATLTADTSGTGWFALRVMKLKPATSYAVTLAKGSCTGTSAVRLSSIRTGRTGATTLVARLGTSQISAVYASTAGGRRLYIRVSAGSTVRCGLFSARIVVPYLDAAIIVGHNPGGLAIDATGVWVTSGMDTLWQIDSTTNTVVRTVPLTVGDKDSCPAIAAGAGSLWVATGWSWTSPAPVGSVVRVDPTTGQILATIPAGRWAWTIAVGAGAVWVGNFFDHTVLRIDPATNAVVASVSVRFPEEVAVDSTSVWVLSQDGTVSRIDPASNRVVATIATREGWGGGSLATGAGAVWVTTPGWYNLSGGAGTVARIDPATNQVVARIIVDQLQPQTYLAAGIAVGGGSVWVTDQPVDATDNPLYRVVQIDAASNRILQRIAVPKFGPYAYAADDQSVWGLYGGAEWAVRDKTTPQPGGVIRIIHGTGTLARPAPVMIAPLALPAPSPSL